MGIDNGELKASQCKCPNSYKLLVNLIIVDTLTHKPLLS